jgi:sulfur relay (sulfurtransferase) DsrF/TusC family protein
MRVLQIIEPAYRATLEEQDDTVLWFTRAIRAAGAPADVLLVGSAANYAVRGQEASGLAIGDWSQRHPPAIDVEIGRLLESGACVTAIHEDLTERGIAEGSLIPGVETLSRKALSQYLGTYDVVWKW